VGSKDNNATFAAAQLQMERSSFGINRTGEVQCAMPVIANVDVHAWIVF